LEPLVDAILDNSKADPEQLALAYLNPEAAINDSKSALDGARDILSERWAEDAELLANMRDHLWKTGLLYAKVIEGKEGVGDNFRDWVDFHEAVRTLPSHRILALLRGRQQGVLDLRLGVDADLETLQPHPCVTRIADVLRIPAQFTIDASARG